MPRSALQAEIKKRRPFEAAEVETFLNLTRTCSVLEGEVESLLKRHGSTGSQYNVLRILRGAKQGGEEALPCLEVAERMVTRVPDITRLVDRLEKTGLVDRKHRSDDRRVVLVSITRAGLNLLSKLDQPVFDLHREQLGHLSRSELDALNRLLVKARASVEQAADD
jgi:DNA-binding MarR family transcriptional regulator